MMILKTVNYKVQGRVLFIVSKWRIQSLSWLQSFRRNNLDQHNAQMIQNMMYLNHQAANVYHPLCTQYDFWKEPIAVQHLDIKLIFVQLRLKYQTNHCLVNFQLCHALHASKSKMINPKLWISEFEVKSIYESTKSLFIVVGTWKVPMVPCVTNVLRYS